MKQTLIILSIILGAITIALLTSWLLSWPWVAAHWARQTIIIIFMVVQLAFGGLLAINYIKQKLADEK